MYDPMNNLLKASDPSATYGYGYDAPGRNTIETQQIPGLHSSTAGLSYQRTYDADGNLTNLAAKLGVTVTQNNYYPPYTSGGTNDFVNDYTYDNLNRFTRLTQYGYGSGSGLGSGSGSGSGSSSSTGNAVAEKRVDFTYNERGQIDSINRYANLTGTQLVAETNNTRFMTGE